MKGRFVIRLLLAADAAWLVFTVSRLLLSGAVWLMVLPDMVPPILLAVVPVVFLAAVGLVRLGRAPISRLAALGTAGAALAALAIGFPQSGLNLAALSSPAKPPTSAVRVMVWDTLGWDTDKNQAAFSRYLGGPGLFGGRSSTCPSLPEGPVRRHRRIRPSSLRSHLSGYLVNFTF